MKGFDKVALRACVEPDLALGVFLKLGDINGEAVIPALPEPNECAYSGCSDPLSLKSKSRCNKCHLDAYCGKICQKGDWPNHKESCAEIPLRWKGFCWNVAQLLVSNNFPLKWEFQGLIVDWIRLWIGLEKGELVTSEAQEGALMGWVMFFAELVSGTGCASTESSKVLGTNTG